MIAFLLSTVKTDQTGHMPMLIVVFAGCKAQVVGFVMQWPISFHTNVLTHLSLASFLWGMGKRNSPRCDATDSSVPSGAMLLWILTKKSLLVIFL